ncbi:hypothetical protein RQP46_003867 [Phenoliferia psychrophenolica]
MAPNNVGTLFIYDPKSPGAHRAARILATAALAKVSVTLDPTYTHGTTNKTPEFRAKFPTAQVAQWQGFVDFSVLNNLIFVYGSIAGFNKFTPELVKAKLAAAVDALAKVDAYLALDGRKFLLGGNKVTLADIAVVSGLVRGYQGVYDKAIQETYPTVFRYTQDILAIPEVKGVYGEVAFAVESPLVGRLE